MHPLSLLLLLAASLALAVLQEGVLIGATTLDDMAAAAAVPSLTSALRRGRGRPRKFAAPSRAVTLTLPETVIDRLSAIHKDLSRAVVGLTQRQSRGGASRKAAELLVFGNRAIITIRPTPSLEKRTGVQLVPLPDGRAMISFDSDSLADLELTINDALDDTALSTDDRAVYEGISAILKEARRSKDVSLQRRNIIVLESLTRGAVGNGNGPLK